MKRTLLMLLILCLALPALAQKTDTGFYYPTDAKSSTGGYYSWWGYNKGFNGYHLAQDIKAAVGDPVYAICDGTVVRSRTDVGSYGGDTPSRTGGGLVLEHYTSTGTRFHSLYAHLGTSGLPSEGTRVYAGQVIARIADYKSGNSSIPHLHFGVMPGNLPSNPWAGCTKDSKNAQGFSNPWIAGSGFLAQNRPAQFQRLEDNSMAREYWRPEVYLLVNGARFWAPTEADVNFFGGWGRVRLYAPGRLSDLPDARPYDGTMYRQRSHHAVYLQLFGARWWVLTEAVVQKWGGWGAVRLVPNGSFDTGSYAGTVR
jgi:hypothetical protein